MLFPNVKRAYDGAKLHSEPEYSFLQRSALPEATAVRELMEKWLGRVPSEERSRLCEEMSCGENRRFTSAFTELYMHELLHALGYGVTYHPDVGHVSGRSPEFLAEELKHALLMEGTTAVDMAEDEARADPDRAAVYDAINAMPIEDFWVTLDERGLPAETPSAKRITRDLQRWIDKLDYSGLLEISEHGGAEQLPSVSGTYRGWTLTFTADPKPEEARGSTSGHVIGVHSFGGREMTTTQALRQAVKRKATRYGELDHPYVVAVNVEASHVELDEVFQAMISTLQIAWRVGPSGPTGETRTELARDGIWLGPDGPRNTRVSAVLIACRLGPWSTASRDLRLVHNPWAARPVTGSLKRLTEWVPTDGRWDVKQGLHPREVLELADTWPSV